MGNAEGVCAALTLYRGIQVRRGVRVGSKKWYQKVASRSAHYFLYHFVLARNTDMTTVAPAASIAAMKAADDLPVV